MVPVAVTKKAFIEIDFTVIFSTLWLTGEGRPLARIPVEPIVRLSLLIQVLQDFLCQRFFDFVVSGNSFYCSILWINPE